MVAELRGEGHDVNRKRVRRLMRLDGHRGDLPEAEHQPQASGPQDIPVFAEESGHRPAQSGVVRGHHVYPDGEGFCVSGGGDGLVQPPGSGVAVVDHDGDGFLRRGVARSDGQHGKPEIFNTDQGVQFTAAAFIETLEAQASRSAWMAKADFWTTSSSSGCGAA